MTNVVSIFESEVKNSKSTQDYLWKRDVTLLRQVEANFHTLNAHEKGVAFSLAVEMYSTMVGIVFKEVN